ncbi:MULTISPECIES: ERF family protein [unclassified Saccharibacter]|uniref:ERF family protein n=1 Tax=unclassified Saccharibacter TaxID=2648722 RepID=UPI0013285689|nr:MULTISPECIES: ERF family protein [unclassified Saccharibacter]MXV35721.1 hypothetical protein [Saccharibacter sp. EH611]MXV58334.1 hypothetical protein [Saccharibacter sp. EH70]MXV65857.1 hypothetical protein [Saccharibacter sp. EH60]
MSNVVAKENNVSPSVETRVNTDVSIMGIISQAATNPQCDVDKMQALLQMHNQVMDREATAEFSRAMSAASGEIPQVAKNGRVSLGGKVGYNFTRWEDMDAVIRPILTKHGLRLSFTTRSSEGGMKTIVGTITHENGKSQSSEMDLPIDVGNGRNALQAFGSSISYGKRYCAEMLLNIVRTNEDKDGVSSAPARQSAQTISPHQKNEIIHLLRKLGMGPEKMLAHLSVQTVDDIPASQFKRVMDYLRKHLEKRGASHESL